MGEKAKIHLIAQIIVQLGEDAVIWNKDRTNARCKFNCRGNVEGYYMSTSFRHSPSCVANKIEQLENMLREEEE